MGGIASSSGRRPSGPLAPLAISIISRVMFACLTLLYESVRSSISSSAFSVGVLHRDHLVEKKLAVLSSTAW